MRIKDSLAAVFALGALVAVTVIPAFFVFRFGCWLQHLLRTDETVRRENMLRIAEYRHRQIGRRR